MRFSQGPCTASYPFNEAAKFDRNETDALDNPVSIVGKFPKCLDRGYTELSCRGDGHTETSELIAKPHRRVQDVPRSPYRERSPDMVGRTHLVTTHRVVHH